MSPAHNLILILALLASVQTSLSPLGRGADCRNSQECRQLAMEAAGRKDYETFHDLAWRVMQTGPKNDPGSMLLLARAQSLSGRPGDALVMLRRLALMRTPGAPNDAATSEDFAAVRLLAGWSEVEARLAGAPAPAAVMSGFSRTSPVESGFSRTTASTTENLRFTTPLFTPAGLAYDAVSRRFIVGDRHARKLTVVDEFSLHVANLASGFADIAALEIDPREGTLWVVSADDEQTTLHKLQLVSGRALGAYTVPASFKPARFVDVAVTSGGAVLALDRAGCRLFRLRSKEQALELAVTLPERPASMAPAADSLVYVAHADGVTRADTASRAATPLKAGAGVDLRGIVRLRWHQGSLIAVQAAGDGVYRAIRIALDPARRTATGITVLEGSLRTTDPTAATVVSGVLYFLESGEGAEMIVRRIPLR